MPIDASIYSQIRQPDIEQPTNALANITQLQNAQTQNKLGNLQLQNATDALTAQNALSAAYQAAYDPTTGQVDSKKLMSTLATSGQGSQLPTVQKTLLDQAKAQREADKAKLEGVKQHIELQGQLLGGVTDQTSWDNALRVAQQNGIDTSQFPTTYNPQVVNQLRLRALSAKDQVDNEWKSKGYDLDVKKFDYQRQNDAANRAVTIRGQDKPQYDPTTGALIDIRTGTAKPVIGPDGQPISVGGKALTEDQAKAAAWLAQSENAFKNMQSAVKQSKSASTPGLGDAVSSLPLMDAVGNYITPEARQKYKQASSSLSEALLRAATGAGVNESEARQKIAEITPQFGDSDAVIKQKMDSIPVYIESLRGRASPKGAANAEKAVSKAGSQDASSNIDALLNKYK
jgi:hypothetical protein